METFKHYYRDKSKTEMNNGFQMYQEHCGIWSDMVESSLEETVAESCSTIAGAFHSPLDRFFGRFLAVVCQSNSGHYIDKERCEVDTPNILAGGVVRREHVVEIVVSLAASASRDKQVLGRPDPAVVWLVSPQVSDTVDCPGDV